jgi:ribonuclease J
MVQRNNDAFPSEAAVEEKIYETIKDQDNIAFLIASSQNIDRIVSAYRASCRAGKTLVIDIYTAWVLEQVKLVTNHVPSLGWENLKIHAEYRQDATVKNHPEIFGDFRHRLYRYRVTTPELQAHPAQYLWLSKMSKHRIMELHKGVIPVNVLYSQWLGYLSGSSGAYYGAEAIAAFQTDPHVNFVYTHTSGHATIPDLQRFAAALDAQTIVPVHTENPELYAGLFGRVTCIQDGNVFHL